jgi:hypothetical protein
MMIDSTHELIDCTKRERRDGSRYSLEGKAELERADLEAGRDYLPMDVFVDLPTVKEHFQDEAVRVRRISSFLSA